MNNGIDSINALFITIEIDGAQVKEHLYYRRRVVHQTQAKMYGRQRDGAGIQISFQTSRWQRVTK